MATQMLEVGNEVIVLNSSNKTSILKVTRTTATLAILGKEAYRVKREVGHENYLQEVGISRGYHPYYFNLGTPETLAAARSTASLEKAQEFVEAGLRKAIGKVKSANMLALNDLLGALKAFND